MPDYVITEKVMILFFLVCLGISFLYLFFYIFEIAHIKKELKAIFIKKERKKI